MGTRPDVASRRSAPSGHVATTTLQRGPFSRCQKVPFLLAISSVRAHGPPAPARGRGRQWPDTARLCAAAHARATDTTRPAIVADAATGRADAAEHEHAPGPAAGACRKAGCHSPAQGHTRPRGVAERAPPAASCPAGEPLGTRMGSTRLATLPRRAASLLPLVYSLFVRYGARVRKPTAPGTAVH